MQYGGQPLASGIPPDRRPRQFYNQEIFRVPFYDVARDSWRILVPALLSTCLILACSDAESRSAKGATSESRVSQSTATNPAVPESVLSFDEYLERFGGRALVDLPTRTIRKDLQDEVAAELVGSQIKWNGYVQSTKKSESGGVVMLISPKPDSPKTDVALVRVDSAEMAGESFADHMPVRVIGRFLKLEGVFPIIDAESVTEI
jgi:hypothetical protein